MSCPPGTLFIAIGVAAAVIGWMGLYQVRTWWAQRASAVGSGDATPLFIEPLTGQPVFPRSNLDGIHDLQSRVFWLALVTFGVYVSDLTPHLLTPPTGSWPVAFVLGVGGYGVWLGLHWLPGLVRLPFESRPTSGGLGLQVPDRSSHSAADYYLTLRALVPRRHRWASWLGMIVVNPLFEELALRYVLVHLLGCAIGNVWIGVAVGAAMTAWIHVYQGWRALPTHLGFALIATWLMYSPAGLFGAVVMHIIGDVAIAIWSADSRVTWITLARGARRRARPRSTAEA